MSMTESEAKAIKWMKNVIDDAVITLDEIKKNHPHVSPMLYAGRKDKAETIIEGFEELEQYRAIGTVSEFRELKEKATAKKVKGKRFEEAICPCCLTELYETYWAFGGVHYCVNCGTAVDWSEGKE